MPDPAVGPNSGLHSAFVKTLPLSEVKATLSRLVDQVASRDEQILITRNGKPVAMLVSPDEIEGCKATLEIMSDPEFMAQIRRGLRDVRKGKYLTYEEVFGPYE